ncbi:hypothetical protein C3941_00130 [Kaistia algarum]|uniref:hypothetical protein n=1 Tax=Kaistia algarum TaxID=2083279 RepID=UPI000CE8C7B5|nr:hypothetical protein [Kaistia algarum]MCX5513376.1 hypothetical protein [Kaistia algarum]PPE81175.1 hypothetical protein C3941_00130 [Kaistia algarum]
MINIGGRDYLTEANAPVTLLNLIADLTPIRDLIRAGWSAAAGGNDAVQTTLSIAEGLLDDVMERISSEIAEARPKPEAPISGTRPDLCVDPGSAVE